MFVKSVKYGILAIVTIKIYKYLYKRMINDKVYLEKIFDATTEEDNLKMIYKTFSEAKKHEESLNFDVAVEYYLYAYKGLRCEKQLIIENILTEKVKGLFEERV